jgi:hypothetical protein
VPKYSETMMDHVLSPRNGGVMEHADLTGHAGTPGRGAFLILFLRIADGRIAAANPHLPFGHPLPGGKENDRTAGRGSPAGLGAPSGFRRAGRRLARRGALGSQVNNAVAAFPFKSDGKSVQAKLGSKAAQFATEHADRFRKCRSQRFAGNFPNSLKKLVGWSRPARFLSGDSEQHRS